MKANTVVALALSLASAVAIPPDSFGFPDSDDDTPLSVIYQVIGAAQPVQPGMLFGSDVPSQAPSVAVNESYESLDYEYTGQYLLFMVDPDASYPENPTNRFIIHWWQEGMTKSTSEVNQTSIGGTRLVNTTAPRVAYRRPRPPTNSSAHRYIQYLFEQPDNFQVPDAYSGYGNQNSSKFPLEDFLDDANLGSPVAANYFYCSNQTAVPATFVAAPGQEYPGGNGAMVTQGENNPTPTSASGSGTASATSSAGSGTATGAPPVATYTSIAVGSSPDAAVVAFGMVLAIGASCVFL